VRESIEEISRMMVTNNLNLFFIKKHTGSNLGIPYGASFNPRKYSSGV
jgi:hypothetical protein